MPATTPDTVTPKRRVTMTSVIARPGGVIETHQAVDYVPDDILDAYVADAKTRWQAVDVGEEEDHGPGGPDGETAELEHLAAGQTLQQHLHDTGVKPLDDSSNKQAGA